MDRRVDVFWCDIYILNKTVPSIYACSLYLGYNTRTMPKINKQKQWRYKVRLQ